MVPTCSPGRALALFQARVYLDREGGLLMSKSLSESSRVRGAARLVHSAAVRRGPFGANVADVVHLDGTRQRYTVLAVEGRNVWTDAGRFLAGSDVPCWPDARDRKPFEGVRPEWIEPAGPDNGYGFELEDE